MICHLDCSTGVSGDKFLGALLDAGRSDGRFAAEHLAELVRRLAPEAIVRVESVRSHGIAATGVSVEAAEKPAHRHLADIVRIIEASGLPERVRERSTAVFTALAEAEAAVHGTDVERVHFHEVGALDAIMDVVGVCAGLEALGVERLVATPVAVGGGTVRAAHGVLPVPAPATASLLLGVPVVPGPHESELTTPTGAALVRVLADAFGPCPPMTPRRIGHGAGTRDIGTPNVCRVLIGEAAEKTAPLASEPVVLLETNLDHLSPEAMAFAAEELLAEGALDVWQAPIVMKKGRSASLLSVLAPATEAPRFAERLIALTGTLGVRRTELERCVADRTSHEVPTEWGAVRVKVGGGLVRPEHEDVARVARESSRPYELTRRELEQLARDFLKSS